MASFNGYHRVTSVNRMYSRGTLDPESELIDESKKGQTR
jgi:hypothetical protein